MLKKPVQGVLLAAAAGPLVNLAICKAFKIRNVDDPSLTRDIVGTLAASAALVVMNHKIRAVFNIDRTKSLFEQIL